MNSCLVVFYYWHLIIIYYNLFQFFWYFVNLTWFFYQLDQFIVCWLQRVCFTAFLLLLKFEPCVSEVLLVKWMILLSYVHCKVIYSFFNWMMLKRDWYLFHKLIPFCYDKMCINFLSTLIWTFFVVFLLCARRNN